MGGVKGILKITLTSLIAALACTGIIYAATTVGTNISTGGTLDVTGAATFTTASSTGIVKFSEINSDTGVISFGDENLTTTGTLNITGLTTLGNASTTLLSISNTAYIGTGLVTGTAGDKGGAWEPDLLLEVSAGASQGDNNDDLMWIGDRTNGSGNSSPSQGLLRIGSDSFSSLGLRSDWNSISGISLNNHGMGHGTTALEGWCEGESTVNCDGACDNQTECETTYGGTWTAGSTADFYLYGSHFWTEAQGAYTSGANIIGMRLNAAHKGSGVLDKMITLKNMTEFYGNDLDGATVSLGIGIKQELEMNSDNNGDTHILSNYRGIELGGVDTSRNADANLDGDRWHHLRIFDFPDYEDDQDTGLTVPLSSCTVTTNYITAPTLTINIPPSTQLDDGDLVKFETYNPPHENLCTNLVIGTEYAVCERNGDTQFKLSADTATPCGDGDCSTCDTEISLTTQTFYDYTAARTLTSDDVTGDVAEQAGIWIDNIGNNNDQAGTAVQYGIVLDGLDADGTDRGSSIVFGPNQETALGYTTAVDGFTFDGLTVKAGDNKQTGFGVIIEKTETSNETDPVTGVEIRTVDSNSGSTGAGVMVGIRSEVDHEGDAVAISTISGFKSEIDLDGSSSGTIGNVLGFESLIGSSGTGDYIITDLALFNAQSFFGNDSSQIITITNHSLFRGRGGFFARNVEWNVTNSHGLYLTSPTAIDTAIGSYVTNEYGIRIEALGIDPGNTNEYGIMLEEGDDGIWFDGTSGQSITGTTAELKIGDVFYANGYVVASLPGTCVAGAITRSTDSDDCSAGSGNGALCVCNNTGNGWVLLLNY